MFELSEKSTMYGPSSELARMAKEIRQTHRVRKNNRNIILLKNESTEMYKITLKDYNGRAFGRIDKVDNKTNSYNDIDGANKKVYLKSYSFKSRNLEKNINVIDANQTNVDDKNGRLTKSSNSIRCNNGSNQTSFNKVVSSNKHERYKRIIWLQFLMISTCLCAFMIVKTLIDYCGYEVITKIRVFNEKVSIFYL
jgi:hypothetical protein